MTPYSLLDGVRDFIGLASTVTVIFLLSCDLQPRIERIKDARRTYNVPERRTPLLWSVFMIPSAWAAAALLYVHHLHSLWLVMGTWLEETPVDRPMYAFLHLYLFILILGGIYALAITILEVSRLRKVFSDLWKIIRFNQRKRPALEDMEAQLGPSITDPINAATGLRSTVGNIPGTTLFSQDQSLPWNARKSNHQYALAKASPHKLEQSNQQAARSRINSSNGKSVTRTVQPPILDSSTKCSNWSTQGTCDNSQVIGSSNEYLPAVDSEGDAITDTSSTYSSSNASSGIDELKYVDEDIDQWDWDFQGVPLRKLAKDSKLRNTNALSTIDQFRHVGHYKDDNPLHLHHASPRLRAADQSARTEGQRLDIGEPLSPCDSCSSACAGLIPTAKRSPTRVPITPTTPTVHAEDADTEMTSKKRKQRERKNRNLAMSQKVPQTARMASPSETTIPVFKDPKVSYAVKDTSAVKSHFATPAPERLASNAARTRTSDEPRPKASPTPASVSCAQKPFLPNQKGGEDEAGPCWKSGEADEWDIPSGNARASMASFDSSFMLDEQHGTSRRVGQGVTKSSQSRRSGSPYPFVDGTPLPTAHGRPAEGGDNVRKNPRALSLDIPNR